MSTYGYIKHSELSHHGILGQKWGVRRYQNEDGSLIEASYRNQDYDNRKSGMFGLSEGYYRLNDDYIDACIKNKYK